jgi:hypothetical protein
MKPITPAQLKKIHVLLNQMGRMEYKSDMVHSLTDGRATSTKDLTTNEAKAFIGYLAQFDGNDKMRKKVIALAYETEIIYGQTAEDKLMNYAKLDQFLITRGAVKKKLNLLTRDELVKVCSQMEAMLKNTKQSKFNKYLKNTLSELNISTSKK